MDLKNKIKTNGQILCIVLHFGNEDDTNLCLETIQKIKDLDIVVSDNDPAQSYSLPLKFVRRVKMIKTGGGVGFSAGNNKAVSAFLNEKHNFIMILNNDTIVKHGAIKLLEQCLLDGDRVGAAGPCMPYAGMSNKIWACGGYINKWKLSVGGLQPKSNRVYEVDYLPGAAILTRADLWKKIGGLSEKFFFAYEEAVYALEVKKYGYKIMVEPRSVILHKVGISSQKKPQYFYNSIRNKIIFSKYLYGKWLGFIYGLLVTAISLRHKNTRIFFFQLRLWIEAVFDELRGKPVTQLRLNDIASCYEKRKY